MRARKSILIVLVTGAVIICGYVLLGVLSSRSIFSECTCTQRDFKTDQDRTAFLQHFLPVTIPAGASAIQFKYDRWQDYSLTASFRLGATDLAAFIRILNAEATTPKFVASKTTTTSAPAITSQPDGTYHFVTCDGYDTGTIRIDSATGIVELGCFSM